MSDKNETTVPQSNHETIIADAREMSWIPDESLELIVTSPPYAMIEMWDDTFRSMSPAVRSALDRRDGKRAFELMHRQLDRVWKECHRVLKPGGFACINAGDATRTIGGDFQLYSNHSRIIHSMLRAGFTLLPDILWRKPTNSPTKFMGSGMLPAGAYVTYEHQYILIFRKGSKRVFRTAQEKCNRRRSAFFWEERNCWFSDVWTDLRGTRSRSGAFPFELPYRLIQMYSMYGDTVLDPFVGTGTTMLAAMVSARSSIGLEVDESLAKTIRTTLDSASVLGERRVGGRLVAHREFVRDEASKGNLKYTNRHYGFPVKTHQEVDLVLFRPVSVRRFARNRIQMRHAESELAAARSP